MTLDTLRQDQANCSLAVDGRDMPFRFAKRSGGKFDSEGSKTFPGSMEGQRPHGGLQITEDVTLEGECVPSRDNANLQWLKSRRGKGEAHVSEDGLDVDGNVIVPGINDWSGVLKSVDLGDYDSSSSETRKFMIEIEVGS
jgi:hypothetical protein